MIKLNLARGLPEDHQAALITRLHKLGWLFGRDLGDAQLKLSQSEFYHILRFYQQFHGLDVTGEHNGQTHRHIWQERMCSHPDVMEMNASLPKWDNPAVHWTLKDTFPGLADADARQAFAWAWQQWALVCGLKPAMVADVTAAQVVANVVPIDGPGGVMGYSQLPDQWQTPKIQNFDDAEPWVSSPAPRWGMIDVNRVACHEIGHAIGIAHLPAGNLMTPIYSDIRSPQAGDIVEAVNRYGPSVIGKKRDR